MLAELSRSITIRNGAQNTKKNMCRRLCVLPFFFFFNIRATLLFKEQQIRPESHEAVAVALKNAFID